MLKCPRWTQQQLAGDSQCEEDEFNLELTKKKKTLTKKQTNKNKKQSPGSKNPKPNRPNLGHEEDTGTETGGKNELATIDRVRGS